MDSVNYFSLRETQTTVRRVCQVTILVSSTETISTPNTNQQVVFEGSDYSVQEFQQSLPPHQNVIFENPGYSNIQEPQLSSFPPQLNACLQPVHGNVGVFEQQSQPARQNVFPGHVGSTGAGLFQPRNTPLPENIIYNYPGNDDFESIGSQSEKNDKACQHKYTFPNHGHGIIKVESPETEQRPAINVGAFQLKNLSPRGNGKKRCKHKHRKHKHRCRKEVESSGMVAGNCTQNDKVVGKEKESILFGQHEVLSAEGVDNNASTDCYSSIVSGIENGETSDLNVVGSPNLLFHTIESENIRPEQNVERNQDSENVVHQRKRGRPHKSIFNTESNGCTANNETTVEMSSTYLRRSERIRKLSEKAKESKKSANATSSKTIANPPKLKTRNRKKKNEFTKGRNKPYCYNVPFRELDFVEQLKKVPVSVKGIETENGKKYVIFECQDNTTDRILLENLTSEMKKLLMEFHNFVFPNQFCSGPGSSASVGCENQTSSQLLNRVSSEPSLPSLKTINRSITTFREKQKESLNELFTGEANSSSNDVTVSNLEIKIDIN